MQTTVVAPDELGDAELGLWRQMIASEVSLWSPFLTPRFSRVIGAHRPQSRVAVLQDGPRIVGFLPYERDSERVGLPLGGGMSDTQAVIAHSDFECDMPGLVRTLGLRVWRFDHVLPQQAVFEPFHEARHRSPTIDLSTGLEAYRDDIRDQSKSVLQQAGRRRRQLAREVGPVSFEWRSMNRADLDTLIRWKSQQYERTDVANLFALRWSIEALHEFFETEDDECTGVLSALHAGDRTIALHFGIKRGPVLHYWFPAYDPAFSKFSPGLVLLLDLVTESPGRDITLIDLGRGEQSYKVRLANGGYDVTSGRVPATGRIYRAALLARHPAWLGRRLKSLRTTRTT